MRLSFWIHQLDSNYFPFQWVCGVLRLPDDDTSGQETVHDHSNSKSFDAWPSEEGKEKISHAKRLHDKYCQICESYGQLPDEWWEYDTDESSVFHFDDSSSGSDGRLESSGEEDRE